MPFYVDVKSEPKGFSQGRRFLCEIQNRELVLKKGKETIEIPVGIHAHSLEKNRLEVQIDDYTIELTIAKLGYYQNQLEIVNIFRGIYENVFRMYSAFWQIISFS